MSDSPVFDRVCEAIEERTDLERLEARGTIRIAVRSAGLDVASIDVAQMGVVLRKVLPAELAKRGVADAAAVCDQVSRILESTAFDLAQDDRAGAAAETLARFGR